MSETDALLAFLVALAASAALTPVAAQIAIRLGAVDQPKDRGLSEKVTPRLGGLAILAGVVLAGAIFLPSGEETRAILVGAAAIVLIGALDDVFDLPPLLKLAGQFGAAAVPVFSGVTVDNITLPFIGAKELNTLGQLITLVGLVGIVNVVNFSDGIDGLAAGVCTISSITFAIIAFDLERDSAGVLAALTAGASLGFLFHNFPPASSFMGDSGSNLLGFLLACTVVQGALKTNAVIALVFPLVILAVPFLDTGFVVAKRLKYRRPISQGDAEHFHHRMSRIGFSQRRSIAYLYAWTALLSGLALALRFIPYSQNDGDLNPGWAALVAAFGLLALAASVYLVYVLEILKFRRLRAWQLRREDPDTSEFQIDEAVERDLETGEFGAVRPED